jgi:UDP-2,3-diacylglucosamine pyrophosphatase LpxH
MGKTFIISDIHLGSDACRAKVLCDFLEHIRDKAKRLILNGDVFDSMDFRRLNKHHWHVLSLLRKISDTIEVVWVSGNHDGSAEVISHLLGLNVFEKYDFESGDKKFLILHGHVFDEFIDKHPIITFVADSIYCFLQKIDESHYVARLAKHSSKQYLRCTEIIRSKAIVLACKQGYDVVCCGHTHKAEEYLSEKVQYFNSGCWTERPSTFIEVKDGEATVKVFD